MSANSKEVTIGDGKVHEISITRQSRMLGILRLSDWVLVLGCVFLLVDILLEVILMSDGVAGILRSGLSVPDDQPVRFFLDVGFLSICAYTGWRHVGVIDARIWAAHLIIFAILALFFTLNVASGLQKDFPIGSKEQGEFLGPLFRSGVIAISSIVFFVMVVMLRKTRIPSLNISLVELLTRLKRKKDAVRINTSRIKRVNTPLGILFVILGALFTVGEVAAYLSTKYGQLPPVRIIFSLWGFAVLLLIKSRSYFQVRAASLLSVDPRTNSVSPSV